MAKCVVVFKYVIWFLDGKLQLALHFPHKEIVDDDVIGRFIQLVLDSDQTEVFLDLWFFVQQIHNIQ